MDAGMTQQIQVQDPRAALMQAAERCVAENGLTASPLTVIHKAAGQRNASATQYHFGSRDGLIQTILTRRMIPLNADRKERLDQLLALKGPLPPLRDIVAVWVQPLAQELRPRNDGNHYLRFIDRLRHDDTSAFAARVVALQGSYREIFRLLERHLVHLPQATRRSRIALAAEQVISSLARLEQELERNDAGRYPAAAVETLIDYMAGGLIAPVGSSVGSEPSKADDVGFHLNFYHWSPMDTQD